MRSISFRGLIVLFILSLLLPVCSIHSQESFDDENKRGICITTIPQHTLIRTYTLEFDKQIQKTHHWLIGSFSYTDKDEDYFWAFDFSRLQTYGFGMAYRQYILTKDKPKGLYGQSGIICNFSTISNYGLIVNRVNYNGMEALEVNTGGKTDEMYQLGVDVKVGYLAKVNNVFFFDFYIGVGYRHSEILSPYSTQAYAGDILSPAYIGLKPVCGVRLGVNL